MRRVISDEPVRLETVLVRLTDDEKAKIRYRAEQNKTTMAGLLRDLALRGGFPEQRGAA